MRKSTEALLKEISKTQNLHEYVKNNSDDFINQSLADYLGELISEKSLKKSDVIRAAGLAEAYGYQIFGGLKNPSRDKVVSLAIGMSLTLDETNRLLKVAGLSELYPRFKRDSIIIFGIKEKVALPELNDLLYELSEYTLE